MIILGLGCNVGNQLSNLREALTRIRLISNLTVLQVSPLYESDALLTPNAPKNWDKPFLNLAIGIATNLEPEELLTKLKEIEAVMGREATVKWLPRVIDIDILAWHEECLHTARINVPHAGLLDRPFALWPLADIAPDWKYCEPDKAETGKPAKELVKKFDSRFDGQTYLHTRQVAHRIDTPGMIGILNLTPDSFSDGGKFNDFTLALEQVENLFNVGADIIDIGAESTRPGGKIITPEEEWARLQPLLSSWNSLWRDKNYKPMLSVDTRKPETVAKLSSYQIDFLNDVSGMADPKMQDAICASTAKIIFMHNLGVPADPEVVFSPDVDVVSEVYQWGEKQLENLIKKGISKERLIFDVGIGFGKNAEQSFALIKNIKKFHDLGIPILVGHSRKSFLGKFTSRKFAERDLETAAFSWFLAEQKVDYLRVHDVDKNMRLLKISKALCSLN